MIYTGSCHCGNIRFKAEGKIGSAMSCNCSLCSRKGSLLWFVPWVSFWLLTPDANAATYTFNQHVIQHRFCATCGIHPFSYGVDLQGNEMAAVNIRCLEGVDVAAIPVKEFDGRSL